MNIAFTICSNNYLAQAKIVGDSFLQYHSDFKFVIGLVDKYATGVDYSFLESFDVIPVEELGLENFEALINKYNIVELNTAVKPSYIHYIFQNYQADKLLYLDPDILVTGYFEELLNLLDTYNIILTPHICTPIDDDLEPSDYHTLRAGVFNLGFIALSNYAAIIPFLNWWHDRVIKYGYGNHTLNMFYDQLWLNFVPVMFENYYILKHPGYNMAVWNLHERWLKSEGADYVVNDLYLLRFFHFSSYKYTRPDKICNYPEARYDLVSRPDLVNLFNDYTSLLHGNNIEVLSKAPVWYYPNLHKKKPVRNNLFYRLKWRVSRAFEILATGE